MADKVALRPDNTQNSSPPEDGPELQSAVARARRAFGLASPHAGPMRKPLPQADRPAATARPGDDRQRRRFVRDGEVPVTYVVGSTSSQAAPGSRLAAAEAALGEERQARHRAERGLAEAQTALRDVQTQLGHSTIARAEAEEALRTARAELEVTKAKLATEREARATAELVLELTFADAGRPPDHQKAPMQTGQEATTAPSATKPSTNRDTGPKSVGSR